MKVKPFKQELIELVLQYLENQLGEKEISKQLRAKHLSELPPWVLENNLLIQKGLSKVIKSFVQMDKKIKQYYAKRAPKAEPKGEDSDQEQAKPQKKQPVKTRKASTAEAEQTKKEPSKGSQPNNSDQQHHLNTSTWVKNKFEPPQKLENIGKQLKLQSSKAKKAAMVAKQASSSQSQQRAPQHEVESQKSDEEAKVVKKKQPAPKAPRKKVQSESQESSEEEAKKPAVSNDKKKTKQQKKVQKQQSSSSQQQKPVKKNVNSSKARELESEKMQTRSHDHKDDEQQEKDEGKFGRNHKPNTAFSRIKPQEIGPLPEQLRDNSFEAKFKFGQGGDEWGRYGHEKLKDTRGDSFKKTKGKLKNKAFQGANIDFNVINSIKLD